ncbi:MAG: preprotein translocase subunit SecY [Candidatus ainarchaeum sp.]|nr:preprotein translocase subunit SecY [Candidatus ainarchaeum sp.]
MSTCTLEFMRPVIRLLPEVRKPPRIPTLNEKLLWTLVGLVIFFVMYHVYPVGVQRITSSQYEFMQIIFASKIGSLITAGIGPIVLASIFLQLFAGAKLINVDMRDTKHKELFSGTQKMLAILLSFFEAGVYVYTGAVPVLAGGNPLLTQAIVALQLAMGSIILLYMDEVLSKYGIGSGISLFIAAGVSLAVVQGTLGMGGQGLLPMAIDAINSGGADAIPKALLAFLPLIFTLVVFAASVYAEGMKVEIPLAFERARGFGGRFPIKFLYVSNLPVILASALMMNMSFFTGSVLAPMKFEIGGVNVFNTIVTVDQNRQVTGGLVYLFTHTFYNPLLIGGYETYVNLILTGSSSLVVPFVGTLAVPEIAHMAVYVLFYVALCIVFGRFWIETTGMDSQSVAEQLQQSGLSIPGYRRDPRIVKGRLDFYIPTITILGSMFVGLLAAFADLTGALGTGTGILLTVGILYKFYEQLSTARIFDLYPDLKKLM